MKRFGGNDRGRAARRVTSRAALAVACLSLGLAASHLQAQAPSPSPQAELADDMVLRLGQDMTDRNAFRTAISQAAARAAARREAEASTREAAAVRTQARAALFPRLSLSMSTNQPLARGFSGKVNTLVEESMAQRRSDAAMTADQMVNDFGATSSRIRAASARLKAAALTIDDTTSATILESIAAWYDVVGYRGAIDLGRASVTRQLALRSDLEQRVANGYLAQGDLARADSYLAASRARLARYQRALGTAQARYEQLFGAPPPDRIGRGPTPVVSAETAAAARDAGGQTPSVRAADAVAEASRLEARAVAADRLPNLGVSLSAGRYGVFENSNDYAVSARATLRMRLSAGFDATHRQAQARADGARARADRIREDAERDAAIAWTDVGALTDELSAMDANYRAARQSRDVLAERFKVSRGTLFDLLEAEESYSGAAESYIQTLVELDAARYVLLARTGRLLPAFGIAPSDEEGRP